MLVFTVPVQNFYPPVRVSPAADLLSMRLNERVNVQFDVDVGEKTT